MSLLRWKLAEALLAFGPYAECCTFAQAALTFWRPRLITVAAFAEKGVQDAGATSGDWRRLGVQDTMQIRTANYRWSLLCRAFATLRRHDSITSAKELWAIPHSCKMYTLHKIRPHSNG